MKRCEALALQEGDLVDVRAPNWQGGRVYGCKVLIVSSKGGIYISGARWVQYHPAVALGRRGELTERERASQLWEIERFQTYREQMRQKERKQRLRNLRPQELYQFAWDQLEDTLTLEDLQARALAQGLGADAATWKRIGRVLLSSKGWKRSDSVIVMPGAAASYAPF